MARNSSQLVIDASIAHSAGESSHPDSVECANFLDRVYEIGYRVVFSIAIETEWERHLTPTSRRWLTAMRRKNRTMLLKDEQLAELTYWELVEQAITTWVQNPQHGTREAALAAICKDRLLVDAAVVSGKIVASCDQTTRHYLIIAARAVRDVRTIVWVNPLIADDACIDWLLTGAKREQRRWLCNQAHPLNTAIADRRRRARTRTRP